LHISINKKIAINVFIPTFIKTLKQPKATSIIPCLLAKNNTTTYSSFAGNPAIFNQIHLSDSNNHIAPSSPSTPIISPIGLYPAPLHTGKLSQKPFFLEWNEAFFTLA
jgi:hypothetical protein